MHATIADHLSDLVENGFDAGAGSVRVRIEESEREVCCRVSDDGCGMDERELEAAFDPLRPGTWHPQNRCCFGIPFLADLVDLTHGGLAVASRKGSGTTVWFRLDAGSVDVPPMGDLVGTVVALLARPFSGDFVVERVLDAGRGRGRWTADRKAMEAAWGPLSGAGALLEARRFLRKEEAVLAAMRCGREEANIQREIDHAYDEERA